MLRGSGGCLLDACRISYISVKSQSYLLAVFVADSSSSGVSDLVSGTFLVHCFGNGRIHGCQGLIHETAGIVRTLRIVATMDRRERVPTAVGLDANVLARFVASESGNTVN